MRIKLQENMKIWIFFRVGLSRIHHTKQEIPLARQGVHTFLGGEFSEKDLQTNKKQ